MRQGNILIPLLFNLYLRVLIWQCFVRPFRVTKWHQTQLSPSRRWLDNIIAIKTWPNVLSSYCNSWMLSIKPKNTKIMIFQRCTRKCEYNFRIGNEVIDVVQNYAYLGTRITSSGNFTLSLEHLRPKALHALFSLRRHTGIWMVLSPHLRVKFLTRWFHQF